MKTIVISGMHLCQNMSGIPRYVYEIVKRIDLLLGEGKGVDIRICYPEEKKFIDYKFKNIRIVPLVKGRKRWMTSVLKNYAKKNDAIICDMGGGMCSLKNSIAMLHDIRPLVSKEFDTFKSRFFFKHVVISSIKKNAGVVVTVSETQKKLLEKVMPDKKIIVIPPAWNHICDLYEDETIFLEYPDIQRGEYYFSLGSIAKHKNYRWIIEVAKRNREKQFVIAGNASLKKWGIDGGDLNIENIIFVGYISDEKTKALMKEAKAFLHPSKYEGFGLPPLEALAIGKNIAVCNSSSLPEVYGKNISYFDAEDYNFDLDKIKKLSKYYRESILNRYSWEKSAKNWLELFMEQ